VLTRLTGRTCKRFSHAEIELANSIVLVDPNNSAEASDLRAFAPRHSGLRAWEDIGFEVNEVLDAIAEVGLTAPDASRAQR